MTDLSDIIERLEKAEAGSRELDYQVFRVFAESEGFNFWNPDWGHEYTCSVDAAISLAGKVLPGWAWKLGTCSVSDDAWVTPDFNSPVHGERLKREFPNLVAGSVFDTGVDIDLRPSGRPAIALCIAILTALKAKAQQQEGGE